MKHIRKETVGAVLLVLFLFGGLAYLLISGGELKDKALDSYGDIRAEQTEGTLVNKLNAAINASESAVDDVLNDRTEFITFHGGFQRLLLKSVIDDANPSSIVVKLNNGMLNFMLRGAVQADVSANAQGVVDFNEFLKERDIPLLFVGAPEKVDKFDQQKPTGMREFGNEEGDALLAYMAERGVATLDLRPAFHEAPGGHYSYFFRTDHHWKPEGAFLAFQNVAQVLEDNYGVRVEEEWTDLSNYDIQVYEDWFLGSQGKRVGPLYAGVDDISIITPKYDTEYTFEVPYKQQVRTGNYREAMIFEEMLAGPDYYKLNPYAAYTGGDYPLNIITNEMNPDGPKVILVRDSFSCAFAPFLSQVCSELHIVDLRYFGQSLKDYVEQEDPDLVMVMYAITVSGNSVLFQFD